jgi:hypothetical protein
MTAASTLVVFTTSEDDTTTTADITTGSTSVAGFTTVDSNGSTFANDGTVLLIVNAAAATTLTVTGQTKCRFGVLHDRAYTAMVSGHSYVFGPFAISHFNDTTGLCHITWGGTLSTTAVCAVKLGAILG